MTLAVKNLTFGYSKERAVLSDISITVGQNEVLSILGPNGTGKTTLLKCVNQLLKPQAGEISFDGRVISDMRREEVAKIIAYVPQYTNDFFSMQVVQAVMMGRLPYVRRNYTERDKQIVFDLLRKMDLEKFAFRNIKEMSGGERQRVFIARAMAQQPRIIILDEPTSSLDLKNQLFILRTITDLAKRETLTIVMTMHDLNLASLFSNKILMLKDAKVFAYGGAQEVLTEDNVEAMYGVNARVTVEDGYKHIRLLR